MDDKRVEAVAWLIGSVLNYECGGDWNKLNDFAKLHYTRVAKSALEMSDAAAWQPIETAPYTGQFLAYGNGETGICHKDEEYGVMCSVYYCPIGGITHWQPLPAPPSDATP